MQSREKQTDRLRERVQEREGDRDKEFEGSRDIVREHTNLGVLPIVILQFEVCRGELRPYNLRELL
jgi:hypothetical protein